MADLSAFSADQLAEKRFKRPNVEAPLIVWEYAMTLERWVINAETRLKTAEDALAYYAQRRNYRLAAGSEPCAENDHRHSCGMEHRDSYDDAGPGARARAALAAIRPNPVAKS